MKYNLLPKIKKERIHLLSWLIIPVILLWISVNYVLGLTKTPTWTYQNEQTLQNPIPKISPYQITTPYPLSTPVNKNQGMVTLWFDDAWLTQFTIGYPTLKENGYQGALAVSTGLVDFENYMSWAQIKHLQENGWEMTGHTISHSCDRKQLTKAFVEYELSESLNEMKSYGLFVQHFVTPCGIDTAIIKEISKKYYLSMRTSELGINTLPLSDPYYIKAMPITPKTTLSQVKTWLSETKKSNGWLILIFHQIDESGDDYSITPEKFAEIIKAVKLSETHVVLPSQAI